MFHSLGHYWFVSLSLLVVAPLCFAVPTDVNVVDCVYLQYIAEDVDDINGHLADVVSTMGQYHYALVDIVQAVDSNGQYLLDNLNSHTKQIRDGRALVDAFNVNIPGFERVAAYLTNEQSFAISNICRTFRPSPNHSFDGQSGLAIAVTNSSETYWLEKIYNRLAFSGSSYTPYSPYLTGVLGLDNYTMLISELSTDLELVENGQLPIYDFLERYGYWLQNIHDLFSHIDFGSLLPSEIRKLAPFLTVFSPSTQSRTLQRLRDLYSPWAQLNESHYGTKKLYDYLENSGLDPNSLISTNFFSSDGSIKNADNSFTNSTSVFHNFATSFLPSGLFNPDTVNTDLFDYVVCYIDSPSFNPDPFPRNNTARFSSFSSALSITNSSDDDFKYNLLNPFKQVTDTVQHDTETDSNFESLANLVNERLDDIFTTPLDNIMSQPARWQVKLIDKELETTEHYVNSQYSNTSQGVDFVCWLCEAMMFFTFFSYCVRRSLNIQKISESSSAI